VRFLVPLAYLSPRIIEAIAEGRAPVDVTVTRLVRNLPAVWADQDKQLGFTWSAQTAGCAQAKHIEFTN
jgi:site-specific DNA recombinase